MKTSAGECLFILALTAVILCELLIIWRLVRPAAPPAPLREVRPEPLKRAVA